MWKAAMPRRHPFSVSHAQAMKGNAMKEKGF